MLKPIPTQLTVAPRGGAHIHNQHVIEFKDLQFRRDAYTVKAALSCLRESSDDLMIERRAQKGGAA